MTLNLNGLHYERSLHTKLLSHKPSEFELLESSAGFSNTGNDLEISYNGNILPIEVKLNKTAQMGGGSIIYERDSGRKDTTNKISQSDKDLLLSELDKVIDNVDYMLDFFHKNDPVSFADGVVKLPFMVTKRIWKEAVNEKIIAKTNHKVKHDMSFIHQHYQDKNVNYIQIGGAGLFYLHDNPLDLNIPQLSGSVNIEFRPGRSGSKPKIVNGIQEMVAGVSYRTIGRLNLVGQSSHSLENESTIKYLFDAIRSNLS